VTLLITVHVLQGRIVHFFGRAKDLPDNDFPIATDNKQLWATAEEWAKIIARRPNQQVATFEAGMSFSCTQHQSIKAYR
jgi:hypothetical protein